MCVDWHFCVPTQILDGVSEVSLPCKQACLVFKTSDTPSNYEAHVGYTEMVPKWLQNNLRSFLLQFEVVPKWFHHSFSSYQLPTSSSMNENWLISEVLQLSLEWLDHLRYTQHHNLTNLCGFKVQLKLQTIYPHRTSGHIRHRPYYDLHLA